MLSRFNDHPASVNETYLQHMGMAFGFGSRMLIGALGCFVHGLFPWLCLTKGSDTVRGLHQRMVMHRVARPADPIESRPGESRPSRPGKSRIVAAE